MPNRNIAGMLTDIGVEELSHVEMISSILYQLTRNLTPEEIKKSGFDTYFVDHTVGVYPQAASGTPFTAAYIGVKGDVLADLHEDLAADGAMVYVQHLVYFEELCVNISGVIGRALYDQGRTATEILNDSEKRYFLMLF